MMPKTKNRLPQKSAFTLVELLVVIAIISILAAMLLPSIQYGLDMGKSISCSNTLRQTGIGFQGYLNDFADVYPLSCPSGGSAGNANSWCFNWGKNDEGIGTLVRRGYTTPDSMFCPGHVYHGLGYKVKPGVTHAHTDYGMGWHSVISNAGGLRTLGGTRIKPYNAWWGSCEPSKSIWPFQPSLKQYAEQWYRSNGRFHGSRVLIADVVAGNWCSAAGNITGKSPSDVPHLANINTLLVDGAVITYGEGFRLIGNSGTGSGYSDAAWWQKLDAVARGENP